MPDTTDLLIEIGSGFVLAARRLGPSTHRAELRLSIEPTALPLLLK